jgi:two-component system sensor histidine kinase BaeS
MKIGVTYRLFLAILAAVCLSVVCMFFIARWNIERGVLQYAGIQDRARAERLADALVEHYGEQESWNFLRDEPMDLLRIMAVPLFGDEQDSARLNQRGRRSGDKPEGRAEKDGSTPSEVLAWSLIRRLEARIVVLDAQGRRLYGVAEIPEKPDLRPLLYRGRIVGYLGVARLAPISQGQVLLMRRRRLTLAMMAGALVLVAAIISFLLARWLVRPVKALTSATDRMTGGDFDIQVPVLSSDELGLLARRFNSLARTLKKNEQARRQLVADVSHELRTPIAVLRSEIEAIQDGVRPATPESIHSLDVEVLRLARLVDDLYQLSLSDLGALSYHKERIDLVEILEDSLAHFRPEFARKGIEIASRLPKSRELWTFADPERLGQLFANLLENSLKYTDGGGRFEIEVETGEGEAKIELQDSPPGIPEEDLLRLFDRLYRVEDSRSRATGGAGLGLAISRNIVEAHGGSITAQASPLGGLRITVALPTKEEE